MAATATNSQDLDHYLWIHGVYCFDDISKLMYSS